MTSPSDPTALELRFAAMDWLSRRPTEEVDVGWLGQFTYGGERIALMDRQRGIRRPQGMYAALSIRTTYTPPWKSPPYADDIGADGLQRYKYRGDDPDHHENVALRRARELDLPLIWFVATARGRYMPIFPVYVVGDEPDQLQFALAVDEAQRSISPGSETSEPTRRYVERLTRSRLHQPVFRTQILRAYEVRCAVCRLGHTPLLDAAHIIGDADENGEPIVPNGLSLCKIHHAAYDANLLGISPDFRVSINQRLLDETDGPMLRHGLQEMHGTEISLPRVRRERPDADRLAHRFAIFRAS